MWVICSNAEIVHKRMHSSYSSRSIFAMNCVKDDIRRCIKVHLGLNILGMVSDQLIYHNFPAFLLVWELQHRPCWSNSEQHAQTRVCEVNKAAV